MAITQTNPTDDLIKRDKFSRLVVTVISPIIAIVLCLTFAEIIIAGLLKFPQWVALAAGLAGGGWLALDLIERSLIVNKSVQAFVTINPLTSLLGSGSALVCYGPGTHFSFWWEQRIAENNIGLGAIAIDISGSVQTKDGTLIKKGSVRFRPDITRLEAFLSGVASIPSEITGLIEAEIVQWLSTKTIAEALYDIDKLNTRLRTVFVENNGELVPHEIETRYGIIIDDVTVSELLPSKEIQETLSAITENRTIDQIVAESFGYKNAKSLNTARKQGKVTDEAITRRRTEVMASSGNLQGMNLSRADYNVNLNGLENISPEVAQAIATGLAAAANRGGSNGQKGGKK